MGAETTLSFSWDRAAEDEPQVLRVQLDELAPFTQVQIMMGDHCVLNAPITQVAIAAKFGPDERGECPSEWSTRDGVTWHCGKPAGHPGWHGVHQASWR